MKYYSKNNWSFGPKKNFFFFFFEVCWKRPQGAFHEIVIAVISFLECFSGASNHANFKPSQTSMAIATLFSRLAHKLTSLQPCKKVLLEKWTLLLFLFLFSAEEIQANNNEFTNLAWKYVGYKQDTFHQYFDP